MVFAVRDLMQDAYPELTESVDRISKAVLAEEKRFAHTLNVGLAVLEPIISPRDRAKYEQILPGLADRIARMAEQQATHRQGLEERLSILQGAVAFKISSTYGVPRH
jgi:alanyl-tRNA synthetase